MLHSIDIQRGVAEPLSADQNRKLWTPMRRQNIYFVSSLPQTVGDLLFALTSSLSEIFSNFLQKCSQIKLLPCLTTMQLT